jgi:protein involved in polysaccharide export with SLBB domain
MLVLLLNHDNMEALTGDLLAPAKDHSNDNWDEAEYKVQNAFIDDITSDYDLVLRDGDRLEVPVYNNQILVWGEVNSPRALRYEDGLSVKDCIYHAGGYTGFAWKRHAYVKYSNGLVKSMRHGAEIEPGCEVIVPVRSVRTDQMITQTIVQMLSSLSTVAAVVIAAVK